MCIVHGRWTEDDFKMVSKHKAWSRDWRRGIDIPMFAREEDVKEPQGSPPEA